MRFAVLPRPTAVAFGLAIGLAAGWSAWLGSSPLARAEDSVESRFLSHVRQVTDSGYVKAGEGYFSPDAKRIMYQAVTREYPFYQIYSQALLEGPSASGPARMISTGRGRTTCSAYRPDGKKIIFASSHLDPMLSLVEEGERKRQEDDARAGRHRRYQWDFDPWMDIFEADPDGSNLKQLTTAKGYDAEGSYSPDGKQIVFCSDRDGDPDIYVMDADGGNVRQLTNSDGYDGGPFFSPDGRWIVFRSDRKQKEFLQIHVIDVEGKHDTVLTDNVGVNWAPYWHPSQPYLIWTGADHSDPKTRPNYDLWLMRFGMTDGHPAPGPITRVTDHASADVLPVFSPNGDRLMWTSNRGDDHTSQLWIAEFALPKE